MFELLTFMLSWARAYWKFATKIPCKPTGEATMRTMDYWRRFFRVMLSPRICGNSLRVSLVVGTVLNVINQGEHLLAGQGVMMGHAVLNYLVPFLVASYSGARAVAVAASDRQPPPRRGPDGS